ncbi:MAG: oligosaccharide flippase family protein [Actinomycetota bacterium]|nr:oligosaccharide flippase family protein [Actinomycetota bacterium]
MTVARQVAWNTIAQVAVRAAVLAVGVVTTGVLTRHLGVGTYGDYVIVMVYISFFSLVFDWGIPTMVARELPRTERPAQLLGTALAVRLALALPVAVLAAAVAFLVYGGGDDRRARFGILVALPTIVAIAVTTTLSALFQVRLRMDLVAVGELVSQTLAFGLILAFVALDRSFYELVLATVIGSTLNAALVLLFGRRLGRFTPTFDLAAWARLVRLALPLGLAIVITTIYFRADALLLSLLKPSVDVGIYGVAYRFFEVVTTLPIFFLGPVFPLMSAAVARRSAPELAGLLQRSFDVLLIAAVGVVAATMAVAPEVVRLIAGESFDDAATPLRVLIVGAGMMFFNSLFALTLVALDRQRVVLLLSTATLVVNVVLNLVFIPEYSYNAAAVIATLSQTASAVGAAVVVWRLIGFTPGLRTAVRAAVAGTAMLLLMVFLDAPFAVVAAAGLVVYGAALLALRVDRELDLAQLLRRA